jgi:hypothetical protein
MVTFGLRANVPRLPDRQRFRSANGRHLIALKGR